MADFDSKDKLRFLNNCLNLFYSNSYESPHKDELKLQANQA